MYPGWKKARISQFVASLEFRDLTLKAVSEHELKLWVIAIRTPSLCSGINAQNEWPISIPAPSAAHWHKQKHKTPGRDNDLRLWGLWGLTHCCVWIFNLFRLRHYCRQWIQSCTLTLGTCGSPHCESGQKASGTPESPVRLIGRPVGWLGSQLWLIFDTLYSLLMCRLSSFLDPVIRTWDGGRMYLWEPQSGFFFFFFGVLQMAQMCVRFIETTYLLLGFKRFLYCTFNWIVTFHEPLDIKASY